MMLRGEFCSSQSFAPLRLPAADRVLEHLNQTHSQKAAAGAVGCGGIR